MSAPVIVSPADPAKIAAVLQAKRARETAQALRDVQRRLMRGGAVVGAYRTIPCRKCDPDAVSILDVERVISQVTEGRGLTRERVLSRSHVDELVTARDEIWWILRHRFRLPFAAIARAFGRHHATIIHGVRRWQARLDAEGAT